MILLRLISWAYFRKHVLRTALTTVTRRLLPAAPNLLAARRPIELLVHLRLPRLPVPAITFPCASNASA